MESTASNSTGNDVGSCFDFPHLCMRFYARLPTSVLVMADGDTHAQWHSLVVYGPPGQATPHAQKKAFPNVWSTRPSGHAGE
eukprot:395562-Amphidinium_carterae.1